MGQCIYVAEEQEVQGTRLRRTGRVRVREIPSELWMHPAKAGETLGKDHLLNTTVGVWFYESDLWDKHALRQRLMALVRQVTSPDFLRDYEEWGRDIKKARTAANRRRPATRGKR